MPHPETEEAVVHIDGASRGNPGPAACAVILDDARGVRVTSFSKFLGRATNNVAEYQALLAALNYALEHHYTRLRVVSDSELLARHITGQYKVKDQNLKVLYTRARALIAQFDSFSIKHVRREENREADLLANQALDAASTEKCTARLNSGGWKPLQASATYHQGSLKLREDLELAEGEEVRLEIHRKP
jgi:ribonuclease HI